jgi:hypothetical protein
MWWRRIGLGLALALGGCLGGPQPEPPTHRADGGGVPWSDAGAVADAGPAPGRDAGSASDGSVPIDAGGGVVIGPIDPLPAPVPRPVLPLPPDVASADDDEP